MTSCRIVAQRTDLVQETGLQWWREIGGLYSGVVGLLSINVSACRQIWC